ncbi:MAG: hypothetical protein QG637_1041 [Chloroflexota bacterium]|nr:hypothetical protein [Chloroflexota bacterium]
MSVRTRFMLIAGGLIVLILFSALIGACTGKQPEATPTPTRTPRPVETKAPPPPTATVAPSDTPAPTFTPLPTPTATPAVTPTPTVDASIIVPGRDPNISPYTGLKPADPKLLERRPMMIKVANQASVHPQSGLSKADIVVESPVEYSETRFTALFHSQDAERVGSVRSARLIDVELPAIFDSVLAYSGGVQPVVDKLMASDFGKLVLNETAAGAGFFRDPNIVVPDNLFANTARLAEVIAKKGLTQRPQPAAGWVFAPAAPAGGSPASSVTLPYPRFRVKWTYDAASGRWKREMGGAAHVDKATGEQLSAADVVILTAPHVKTLILEHGTTMDGQGQACSNCSIEIQLWGEGPARVLRDGKVYEGKWIRPGRREPFRIVDGAGKDIPLKPGNSWWQVVPPDLKLVVAP